MDGTVLEMQAQLLKWQLRITRLASAVHGVGAPKDFDALVYIDELKVLHVTARAKLDQFEAAGDDERRDLEAELKHAWRDMELAFENLGS